MDTMDSMDHDSIATAGDLALHSERIEVFSGAGMSADSGLEVYRSAESGLWDHVDPQAMASIDAWARDPEPMWAWYLWRARVAQNAYPHAGHLAIGEWERLQDVHVTTQNIDDLHERGNFRKPTHLHGSLFAFRCCMCGAPARRPELPEEPSPRLTPPTCSRCGNLIRPGVVWFGEPLPQREWQQAEERMATADLVVIVGTSGIVQPAASLPIIAKQMGAKLVEISPQTTDLTPQVDVFIQATAQDALPALVAHVREGLRAARD